MKKALIITWNGYQDQEVVYPYYRLLEEGFEVDILAEAPEWIFGILGTKMLATKASHTLNINDIEKYDFLLLPGGVKSLEKVRQEKNVLEFVKAFVDTEKVVASTCHGAQLLISSKVTKGRKISGYYSIQDDIANSGATYVNEPVVVDGSIVSSPHYDHMGVWMKTAIQLYHDASNE